jgi:hypothetical protein
MIHWIGVAAVAAALGLGFSETHGQGITANAAAEGRPAMAGAQGGLGAQPGLQQGGLGVRGVDGQQQLEISLKRRGDEREPPLASVTEMKVVQAEADKRSPEEIKPMPKKPKEVKPDRSASAKAARAAKRSVERARHGVSGVDAAANTAGGAALKP